MHAFVQADATRLPLADSSVALTFCSPPYMDARTYGIGAQRHCLQWVEWMLKVIAECQRVTVGPVLVVAAGVTRKRNYQPGPEGLMWEWWKRGGDCQLYRPCFWHRVGIPGSGGTDWLRADVEYVMCFKRSGALAWSDNTACGHVPKWGPGGEMSHRMGSGARVNQWGKNGSTRGFGNRKADGSFCRQARPSHRFQTVEEHLVGGNGFARKVDENNRLERGNEKGKCVSPVPTLANPGNLIRVNVGGGVMGHPCAHENEAPFPEGLAEFFIKSFAPPGSRVLDPFSGSGTTAAVASRLGRIGLGMDLRFNQCELGERRVRTPYAKKAKSRRDHQGQMRMFA